MTNYKLHCFKESGNSYKVALALSIAGLEWEKVNVDYFNGQTRNPAWRAEVNEQGEVPVLEFDGHRMTQSGVILMHLSQQVECLGLAAGEREEALRWLLFDNHKFTANLASYRWLRTFAQPAPHEAVLAYMRQRTAATFDIVEHHLAGTPYIIGKRLTVADISMAGYVFYPKEELGFDIGAEYPRMSDWMARVAETPGWREPYAMLG